MPRVRPNTPQNHSEAFIFKGMDRFQMAKMIDDKLPISLSNIEGLIDRVYNRYPLIEKQFVVSIIKKAFEVIRERLVLGSSLHLDGIAASMKLFFYRANHNVLRASVSVSTPVEIEKS
jgi:hypothetical protein